MKERSVRRRFYLEVVLGVAGLVLFAVTLAWNDWIEENGIPFAELRPW